MSGFRLVLYTRKGCHLCDDARDLLLEELPGSGASLEEVDVDLDPQLTASFGDRIPVVVTGDGQVIAEGQLERRSLRRALARRRA